MEKIGQVRERRRSIFKFIKHIIVFIVFIDEELRLRDGRIM